MEMRFEFTETMLKYKNILRFMLRSQELIYIFFSQHDVFDGKIIVAVSCSHGFERLCISLLHKKMAV